GVRNDAWDLTLGASPTWTQLAPAGTAPPPRELAGAVYDGTRQRMIVFGGSDMADTWALSLDGPAAWSELAPAGGPPGRSQMSLMIDAMQDRLMMYGGEFLTDLWQLPLSGPTPTWSEIALPEWPAASGYFVYDPPRHRALQIGATDLWSYSLSQTRDWNHETIAGPAPAKINYSALVYDPNGDRFVSFGGIAVSPSSPSSETWALVLGGAPHWEQLAPEG